MTPGWWLLPVMGVSLLLTLAVELSFAAAVGVRRGRDFLAVVLVNVLTNPVVVLSYYLISYYTPARGLALQLPLEVLAVAAEALCYRACGLKRPMLFSLGANTASYGAGLLLKLLG